MATSITADQVESYLLRQEQERSANASNKDRKNLMAMFSYGVKLFGFPLNPVAVTEARPHDVKLQPVYTEQDILQLLSAASREESIILKTFLETAGRRYEVFRLTWQDINIERQEIRLWTRKTKTGGLKHDWIPISNALTAEYLWWLNNRPLKACPWVFPNIQTGEPYVDPRKWLARVCKRAKVENLGFHAFRRYVASILDDKYKASRKTIQKLLRHSKGTTTERYLHQIHSDLRDMAGMAVPQGKNKKVPRERYPKNKTGLQPIRL